MINVGSGEETSLDELITALAELTGKRPDVIRNHQQGGGLPRLVADLDQARALLGYLPHVPLRVGLMQMIEDARASR